jgi:hypothetical protein
MGQFDTNYIIFRNVENFQKKLKKLSEIFFFLKGNKESDGIF